MPYIIHINELYFRDGPITADISVDHQGVVPGERLEVNGEVVNDSNRDIDDVNITLYETAIFKKTHVNKTRKVFEINRGGVEPHSSHSLSGLLISIPSLAPSMVTSLINVNYWLKLEVELPGFYLEPLILLTVGTVPVHRFSGQFGPLCLSAPQHWGQARMKKKEKKQLYKGDREFAPLYRMFQYQEQEMQLY